MLAARESNLVSKKTYRHVSDMSEVLKICFVFLNLIFYSI